MSKPVNTAIKGAAVFTVRGQRSACTEFTIETQTVDPPTDTTSTVRLKGESAANVLKNPPTPPHPLTNNNSSV